MDSHIASAADRTGEGAATTLSAQAVWLHATLASALVATVVRGRFGLAGQANVGMEVWLARFGHEAQRSLALLGCGLLLVMCARTLGPPARERVRLQLVSAGVLGLCCFLLARALTSGPWVAAQPWVDAVAPAMVLLGAAAGVGSAWLLARAHMLPVALALALLAASGVGHALDVRVLPGLYAWAHVALACAATALSLLGARALVGRSPIARGAAVTVASALVLALGLSAWFTMDDSTRRRVLVPGEASALALAGVNARPNLLQPELERLLRDWEAGVADVGGPPPAPVVERSSPGQREQPEQPEPSAQQAAKLNVILIGIDTLRADALPPARSATVQSVTPFLDGWLQQGVRFRRAYASSTSTRKSIPSLLFGEEPQRAIGADHVSLASHLAASGYRTLALLPHWFTLDDSENPARRAMMRDFKRIAHYPEGRPDRIVEALDGLSLAAEQRPFVLWVHYMMMHEPRLLAPGKPAPDGPGGYTATLQQLDRQLARLHRHLADAGVLDQSVVVLFSDHGEAFGEHGVTFHGVTVFDEEARVPLAIWAPELDGKVVEQLASNLDIAPTVSALVGVSPARAWRGWALTPWLLPAAASTGALAQTADPVERQLLIENRSARQLGVVRGTRKLIYDENFGTLSEYQLASDARELSPAAAGTDGAGRSMMRTIFAARPHLARRHGKRSETARLALRYLTSLEAPLADDRLGFALAVARAAPDVAAASAQVRRLFVRSDDASVRLMLLEHFADAPGAPLEEPTRTWLQSLEPTGRAWVAQEIGRRRQAILMPPARQ